MELKFTKMQGLGNDFVVIDGYLRPINLSREQVCKIADRHFGVGCDQVLLVEATDNPQADFRYRIFNADGSEVSQCGNGARCFARFVKEKGLSKADEIIVETGAGLMTLKLLENDDVEVNMGIPRHMPSEIPLKADQEKLLYSLELNDGTIEFAALSMGNPHAVLVVDDVDNIPIASRGPELESHPIFPERANIGFLQIMNRQEARLRVFERGSGETLACGSGACAAAVSGIELGILDSPVHVQLPGGSLIIDWQGRGTPVRMIGPAGIVFEGEINI